MKKCSNRFVVIATILIAICIIPQISDGGSAIIKETDFWKASDKADYPKVIVKGSPDNEPVKYWKPEPFEGTGELVERWREDLQHSHYDSYLNNTSEGWLFTSDHDYDDSSPIRHINRLIDPYNGEVELLEQQLSMCSPISTDPFVYTEHYANNGEFDCGSLWCYDIKNKKQRWYIENPKLFPDRTGISAYVIRMIPIIHDNKIIYFKHDSLVGIDSRTGKVLWSYDRKDQFPWTMELFPYATDKYYWILYIKGYAEGYEPGPRDLPGADKFDTTLFRYDINKKKFEECLLGYGYCALLESKSTIITIAPTQFIHALSDDIEVILKWHDPVTLEKQNEFKLRESFLELHPEYGDIKVFPFINKNVSKYALFTFYLGSKHLDDIKRIWYVSERAKDRIPNYDWERCHFLLDRNNPEELIEVSPALTDTKNTFVQVVDDELIIQTPDTITCYDPDKLTEKWTIDKSEYEKPEEAFVYAVDYRGVLVCEKLISREDHSLSRFHCYEMSDIQPIPEPEPVPEPKPEPTPEPTPDPLPVEEKIILKFKIDVKEYSLDGVISPIDTSPIIKNKRTLIPARFVTEPLGGDVSWDVDEKKVVCILGDITIEMWINEPIALVNGKEVQIDPHNPDVTPTIIDDRTMVPIRFLAENLGCETKWDADTREIILTYTP